MVSTKPNLNFFNFYVKNMNNSTKFIFQYYFANTLDFITIYFVSPTPQAFEMLGELNNCIFTILLKPQF